jgi:hypothetical protein
MDGVSRQRALGTMVQPAARVGASFQATIIMSRDGQGAGRFCPQS